MTNRPSLADRLYMFGAGWRFRHHGMQDLGQISHLSRTASEWYARREIITQGILRGAGLVPFPRRTPLNGVVHSRREHDGYAVENVHFESIPGFLMTGNLYTPLEKATGGKRPALLKPHGHFKDGRFREDNQIFCATVAAGGAVVFTYDMVGWGECTQVAHGTSNVLALQLINSVRAMDFLSSLPGVDPGRVGITGASGGGTQAFFLAAIDERVSLSAPMLMVSSRFFGGCTCESGMLVHKGNGWATNNAEIAAMHAPKPQLLVSCGTDWTRMTPWEEFPFVSRIYDMLGAREAVENVHLPLERHDLGPSKRAAVRAFLVKHGWIDGEIDEHHVTIESREVMNVFNVTHPRPDGMLDGEAAVMARLRELEAEH